MYSKLSSFHNHLLCVSISSDLFTYVFICYLLLPVYIQKHDSTSFRELGVGIHHLSLASRSHVLIAAS